MAEEIFKDQITDESISAMKNTLQNDYKTFKVDYQKFNFKKVEMANVFPSRMVLLNGKLLAWSV